MNNYILLKDEGRKLGYRSAIMSLKAFPEKITSVDQVENLSKIGKKIKKKIFEILETGTLERVNSMNENARLKSLKEFTQI